MYTKASKWDPEQIIDTRKLQIHSLKEVMSALGYQYQEGWVDSHPYFYSEKYSNKGRGVISVQTAIGLYNDKAVKCIFGRPPSKLSLWSFNDHEIAKAKSARILRSLKIQYCYRTKNIIVQDHRVQFQVESYKNLFLYDKYL